MGMKWVLAARAVAEPSAEGHPTKPPDTARRRGVMSQRPMVSPSFAAPRLTTLALIDSSVSR